MAASWPRSSLQSAVGCVACARVVTSVSELVGGYSCKRKTVRGDPNQGASKEQAREVPTSVFSRAFRVIRTMRLRLYNTHVKPEKDLVRRPPAGYRD